ncbi:MAG: ABC transporter ATP-binding protein [Gammaproteobacteria bacterium]|nr:MAG: ABC transporter ATP-binding protein [Gammaproteobacteria bacterium]
MSTLEAKAIGVTLGGRAVLERVDLRVTAGDIVGLLGPNGAGKSTLLRVLARVLGRHTGSVRLDGRCVDSIPRPQLAKLLAYLPQGAECHWPMAVEQVVALGRLPHRRPWAPMSAHDWDCVERAMATTDVEQFRGRSIGALSMGERARVLVARAVAGQPRILLADEPVAGLDPAHQLEVMAMLERMAADGAAVIVVLHDLTLAARHCSRLTLLGGGRLVASGDADTVLSTEHLRDCFGIRALSGESPEGPFVIPVARVAG